MRNLIVVLAALIFASCMREYDNTDIQKDLYKARKAQALDTLICHYTSSTGSLDLYCLQGTLTLPADIKRALFDTSTRDIKVCGNFPKDLINPNACNFETDVAFRVVGKTISIDTNNGIGNVPLFYVVEWEKFEFDEQYK